MEELHVQELLEFLRFRSVSTDPVRVDEVRNCAEYLYRKFRAMGLAAEVHQTAGHPILVAQNAHQPDRRTVLIYGHYDVQPEDPVEEWTRPPFDPQIVDGRIWARGATDNKGQIFAHICGVEETLKEEGELPLNVTFLIEGEEEIGSPNLQTFLEEHRGLLACDVVAVSDTGMVAPGVPTMTYGTRGVTALEVVLDGPSSDLHSGIFGGAVANPIAVLTRLLASLHDENGRVAVEGYYERVEPLQDWEREEWAALPLTDADWLANTGSPRLAGEAGYSTVERVWARPTLEINGIGGGFQGVGTKTVLPRRAFAKITCRLVPEQKAGEVQDMVETHLRAHCPDSVRMTVTRGHSGAPFLMNPQGLFGKAALRALETTFGRKAVLTREGGTLPILEAFRSILEADTLLLGLALPDCHAHAPDENFPLENFHAGVRLNRALLAELAKL